MKRLCLILNLMWLIVMSAHCQINTDRVMSIGKNALYFEDYVLAMQYFNQVIGSKPYLAEPYFCRAVAKINLEDYSGAERDCSAALERNPFIVKAYHCRGIARLNLGLNEEAMKDFEQGLEFDPANQALQLCVGVANMQIKEYEKAKDAFSLYIKKHPKAMNGYVHRARSYLMLDDTSSAIEDARRAVELDRYSADARAIRAIAYAQAENHRAAIADYDEAVRLAPNRKDFFINRALSRYHVNDLRGAMSDYDAAIELDPDNAVARFNRGLLRAEVGDKNKAIEDFDRVVSLEPDNYMAIYNRALMKIETGDGDGAIADVNMVIDQYPDVGLLYHTRAAARRRILDNKGAMLDDNTAYVLDDRARRNKPNDQSKADKTRKKGDKNIRQYSKMVAVDPSEEEKRITYKTDYRGKVQNVNADISLAPDFFLSYYKAEKKMTTTTYYCSQLESFNRKYDVGQKLLITNEDHQLGQQQVADHFASLNGWSKLLEHELSPVALFARALDYYFVQDYQRAQDDMMAFVSQNPNEPMAYLFLSNVCLRRANSSSEMETNEQIALGLALSYIDKCLALAPEFAYAAYNRANILVMQKKYDEAVVAYDRALSLDRNIAEIYFNRGLTQIYLGNNKAGLEDLSRAGEMGIFKAYNVIKRYSDSE